jgi:hypothetical protein
MSRKIVTAIGIAAVALPAPSILSAQIETGTTETAGGISGADAASAEPSEEGALTFEMGADLEYDSNIALLEVDTSTNAGDTVGTLRFGLGYDMPNDGRFDWNAGYNFSQTMHQDFDAFDLRLHRGSSTLSWDFGRVDFGVMLQHADAELDGQSFMTLTQVSPYLTKLAGSKLFLRFAYVDTDKDFAGNSQRAADAESWTSDVYIFLDGLTTYLLLGARIDDEDAIDGQFDYEAQRFRLQVSHRFSLRSRTLTFRAGLRTESRDYSSVTPSIGAIRSDDRLELDASAELPLGDRLTASFELRRANNDSNLSSVDFNEDVVSLGVTTAF